MDHVKYYTRRILDLHSFLSRFDDVVDRGGRSGLLQFEAKCPSHETNHRSLAIAKTSDGRYLVHCHAGCTAADVLAAVGLSLSDLYPDGALADRYRQHKKSLESRVDAGVLDIATSDREAGKRLSEEDKKRERSAWIAKNRRGFFA